MSASYAEFLDRRTHSGSLHGFEPVWVPGWLYDFQVALTSWAVRKGRCAIFADCGLGKTPMQLVWAENVARHTGKPVLIATPLAVSYQVVREAQKFGLEAHRSGDGTVPDGARIVVTNYERLDKFDSRQFGGMVCDESSILKNFDGKRRAITTEFLRKLPYRLLCTATAAPNDYIELGTSSEALGELGYLDMLQRFFKNDQNVVKPMRYTGHGNPRDAGPVGGHTDKWRFKGHAEPHFWRWVSSWARACRKPSDLGFDDSRFALPELTEREHIVTAAGARPGMLFAMTTHGLQEERAERRRTLTERCERVAEIVSHSDQALVWCHMNDEGDLLAKLIPDAVQVAGRDDDDDKESRLIDFAEGRTRVLITKPKIGAWGLNLQRCAHVTFFPSHSYEQYYQGVRRCWRFGQNRPVTVDVVATESEHGVMLNLKRKADQADRMFAALIEHMNDAVSIDGSRTFTEKEQVPAWL